MPADKKLIAAAAAAVAVIGGYLLYRWASQPAESESEKQPTDAASPSSAASTAGSTAAASADADAAGESTAAPTPSTASAAPTAAAATDAPTAGAAAPPSAGKPSPRAPSSSPPGSSSVGAATIVPRDVALKFMRRLTGHAFDSMSQVQRQGMLLQIQLMQAGQRMPPEQIQDMLAQQFAQVLQSAEEQLLDELHIRKDDMIKSMEALKSDTEVEAQFMRFLRITTGDVSEEEERLRGLTPEQLGMSTTEALDMLQASVDRSIRVKSEVVKRLCAEAGIEASNLQKALESDEAFATRFVSVLQRSVTEEQAALVRERGVTVEGFEEAVRAYSLKNEQFMTKAHSIRQEAAKRLLE